MENQETTSPRRVSRALGDLWAARLRDPAAEVLLQLVDLSLAGILFFAPLIMAGRHPWGRLVLVTLAATSAVCWAFYQARRRRAAYSLTGLEWLLPAGAMLLALQLLPLPAVWLHALSPQLAEMLPLWNGADASAVSLGTWTQVSLHPEATRGALVMYLSYALLFLVIVQRIETREDAERLVRWIAIAAIGMALLGLFQLLTFSTRFAPLEGRAGQSGRALLRGSFGDPDYFAHFLALGLGPLVWWTRQQFARRPGRGRLRAADELVGAGQPPEQVTRLLLVGGLAAVVLAALLTLSRGGILAMLVAAFTVSAVSWYHGFSRYRASWGLVAVACLLGVGFWVWTYEPLMRELGYRAGTSAAAGEEGQGTWEPGHVWLAGMRAASDFPLLGTGAGTHADVLPAYMREAPTGESRGVGNGYLQLFQETGLAGFLLLLFGFRRAARWSAGLLPRPSDQRTANLSAGVAASVAAGLLQTLLDAPWSVPACLSVTVIALACACRLFQWTREQPERNVVSLPRSAWIAAVFVLLFLSLGMLRDRLPPAVAAADWDRYVTLDVADGELHELDTLRAADGLPAGVELAEESDLLERHLRRVLLANPQDAGAHLQLAQWYVRSFERQRRAAGDGLTLAQLRQAADGPGTSRGTPREQWLERELGPHRPLLQKALEHARHALRQCPFHGEAYLMLAELSFLEAGAIDRFAYLDQAIRVRPQDARVLMIAGREAAATGDLHRAALPWRRLTDQHDDGRLPLLDALADQVPAGYLLRQLPLDIPALRRVYIHYRDTGQTAQAREGATALAVALRREVVAQDGPEAAATWYELHTLYRVLNDSERALDAARQAVQADPENAVLRRALADRLRGFRR